MAELKRIVVIGCSYGKFSILVLILSANQKDSPVGAHVAQQLASRLHATHYVVAIEAKSHFEHLFVSPRFSTPALRGLEHKAFVPFTGTFSSAPKDAGEVVQARVTAFDDVSVSLDRPVRTRGINEPTTRIPYDFLVLATGTRDPGTGAAAGIVGLSTHLKSDAPNLCIRLRIRRTVSRSCNDNRQGLTEQIALYFWAAGLLVDQPFFSSRRITHADM